MWKKCTVSYPLISSWGYRPPNYLVIVHPILQFTLSAALAFRFDPSFRDFKALPAISFHLKWRCPRSRFAFLFSSIIMRKCGFWFHQAWPDSCNFLFWFESNTFYFWQSPSKSSFLFILHLLFFSSFTCSTIFCWIFFSKTIGFLFAIFLNGHVSASYEIVEPNSVIYYCIFGSFYGNHDHTVHCVTRDSIFVNSKEHLFLETSPYNFFFNLNFFHKFLF